MRCPYSEKSAIAKNFDWSHIFQTKISFYGEELQGMWICRLIENCVLYNLFLLPPPRTPPSSSSLPHYVLATEKSPDKPGTFSRCARVRSAGLRPENRKWLRHFLKLHASRGAKFLKIVFQNELGWMHFESIWRWNSSTQLPSLSLQPFRRIEFFAIHSPS